MTEMTLDLLLEAGRPGGASCLTMNTRLAPAGGAHTSVAPAKFAPQRQGTGSIYAYENRYLDGALHRVVMIDSKQSQLNRIETAIELAIADGNPMAARLPRLELTHRPVGSPIELYSDLTLPHRAFDGQLRAASIDGQPATSDPRYIALRDATPVNARALFEQSPITLAFGGWDASRKSRQGRWRSALVGEIVGFCGDAPTEKRGGARVDPVAMQVRLAPDTYLDLIKRQPELSDKLVEKETKAAAKATKDRKRISASPIGLGGIPPSLDQPAGVACHPILRTHVLSFAALRQIRFGIGPDAKRDAACRSALAALALFGLTRANAELCLRANCDLVEAGESMLIIDGRQGRSTSLDVPDVETSDEILRQALERVKRDAGIEWSGQILSFEGDPLIIANMTEDEEES